MFDIHKVKPVHGWREFIGEVGIIVLGVLIALALEQITETIHWHNKVIEAKDALRVSAALDAVAAIEQQIIEPCVNTQLDTLEARLFARGAYEPPKLYTDFIPHVVRVPTRPGGDSVWSTVTGEATSTHFDPEFRFLMDRLYFSVGLNHDVARQVDEVSGRLNAMSLPITRDPITVAQFARDIEDFRAKEAYLTVVSAQVLAHVAEAGMLPPKAFIREQAFERSGTVSFCRANHLPLGRPHEDIRKSNVSMK